MRAVVFPRSDEYELTDVSDTASSPDGIIVSVKVNTICATDVKILDGTVPSITFWLMMYP